MADEPILVPQHLTRPHPIVTATKGAAVGLKAGEDGRIAIGPRPGLVNMVLSRSLLRRALLIAQAIASEAERRGWEVSAHEGSGYGDRGGAMIVLLTEPG